MYTCKSEICDLFGDFCWYCIHSKYGMPLKCKMNKQNTFASGLGYCDDFLCRIHEQSPETYHKTETKEVTDA